MTSTLNRQINILLCAVNVHVYACDKYLKSENHLKNYGDQGGCYPLRLKVSGSKQMLLFVGKLETDIIEKHLFEVKIFTFSYYNILLSCFVNQRIFCKSTNPAGGQNGT